jgi:hypothetical protein
MTHAPIRKKQWWIVRLSETACLVLTAFSVLAIAFRVFSPLANWLLLLGALGLDVVIYYFLKQWLVRALPTVSDDAFVEALIKNNQSIVSPETMLRIRSRLAKRLGLQATRLAPQCELASLKERMSVFGDMDQTITYLLEDVSESFAERGLPPPPLVTIGDVTQALIVLESNG